MRYIGCKTALLSEIDNFISENINIQQTSFCDIFSGTAVVAEYFKKKYKIISNDILYFSYVLQKAYIENNNFQSYKKLCSIIGDPYQYFQDINCSDFNNGFFLNNYSPYGSAGRMYFSEENARKIDYIRNTIEKWKFDDIITENEYYCLLASLIEAIPYISNITGTYGAYLKKWDNRANNKLCLLSKTIVDNSQKNEVFNEDANLLIKKISGDIIYIDPPYNCRQYAPNYHILETVARYDNPILKGVTGIRPYNELKSAFCNKKDVTDVFDALIQNAHFSHIFVSYSSSGLMSEEFISHVLKNYGIATTYAVKKIPYRKYKSKIYNNSGVSEYLFYVRKK